MSGAERAMDTGTEELPDWLAEYEEELSALFPDADTPDPDLVRRESILDWWLEKLVAVNTNGAETGKWHNGEWT
jgi:hypothetical protein